MPAAATAWQVADATTALWFDVSASLQPILGAGGVAALDHRSLIQTRLAHPCLVLDQADRDGIDLPLLHASLSRQPPAATTAAAQAWFGAFHAWLASLVGPAITETLLRPVLGAGQNQSAVQDIAERGNAHPTELRSDTIDAVGIRMVALMSGTDGLPGGRAAGGSAVDP